jgi:hypothetical protein
MEELLIGYAQETLTVDNSVTILTAATYQTGKHSDVQNCVITVEDAAIRFWTTGATPVATSSGHLVNAGDTIQLTRKHSVENFKAIRDTGTNATIQVTYEGNV